MTENDVGPRQNATIASSKRTRTSVVEDHSGHRGRLRRDLSSRGLDGLDDYKAVEMLLTLCIPRQNVSAPAKAAVARFGSLRGVIDADPSELQSVDGIGPATSAKLRLVRLLAEHYLRQRAEGRDVLADRDVLHDYCRFCMGHLEIEQFRVIFVDGAIQKIGETASEGTVDRANVFPREVVTEALRRRAAGVIVVHNHPTGDVSPSHTDKLLTRQLVLTAAPASLQVHDHLIVSQDEVFSFREAGLL